MSRIIYGQPVVNVYPSSNYTYGQKSAKNEKDHSLQENINRMRSKFEKEGICRTVEAVLLVSSNRHSHVLLLQLGENYFKFPGGRLKPGEGEMEGLKRKLNAYLSPAHVDLEPNWEIGECIGTFWRPNFDTLVYPYIPPHITKPKEVKKLFIVTLPEKMALAIPKNFRIIAIPFFEIYDNQQKYGPLIASIPSLVSRFRINLIGSLLPIKLPNEGGKNDSMGGQYQMSKQQNAYGMNNGSSEMPKDRSDNVTSVKG